MRKAYYIGDGLFIDEDQIWKLYKHRHEESGVIIIHDFENKHQIAGTIHIKQNLENQRSEDVQPNSEP